jgi:hypothetical protein
METQKATLDIPKPKFAKGDFVFREWHLCGKTAKIYCRIEGFTATGHWSADFAGPKVFVDRAEYTVTVQEGSLTTEGTAIRPGTVMVPRASELEASGTKTEPPATVWEPDSFDNINGRIKQGEPTLARLAD